ncbi:MAG: hypothetical protein ABSE57_20785 [Bryobacteraceae bacterium]|jgi:peptide subunit release factor 1 (eRF1)
MTQYRARGLAVVGLHETLEALADGQVEELLISGRLMGVRGTTWARMLLRMCRSHP